MIEKEDFDVVITDIKSIGIDGIKKIREVSEEQADIIIVSECDNFYYAKKPLKKMTLAFLYIRAGKPINQITYSSINRQ